MFNHSLNSFEEILSRKKLISNDGILPYKVLWNKVISVYPQESTVVGLISQTSLAN